MLRVSETSFVNRDHGKAEVELSYDELRAVIDVLKDGDYVFIIK